MIFVLDANKKALLPCHPARARKLLAKGEAAVFRFQPYTIILKKVVEDVDDTLKLKIDPGSKFTGLALLNKDDKVVWACEIQHRGIAIKKKLESRRALRRGRRNRLHYRKPKFRTKGQIRNAARGFKSRKGKLQSSVQHRVDNVLTWVKRIISFAPVKEIVQELVKFDMQLMDKSNIAGVEYQQGELQGFEVKEYLLEKYKRTCVYCKKSNIPLEVEHVVSKARGGTNRISNLVLSCAMCNQKKGSQPVDLFLKKKPALLKNVISGLKKPLMDAAAVNATRWFLFNALKDLGKKVTIGSGALTKFNRKRFSVAKEHWKDAVCTGLMNKLYIPQWLIPLKVRAIGQGGRQKVVCDKFGYPNRYRPLKPIFGWRSGDVGKCSGKIGRITPRSNKSFLMSPFNGSKPFSRSMKIFTRLHKMDGYVAIVV